MKKLLVILGILFSVMQNPSDIAAQEPNNLSAVCGTVTAQRPNGRFEVFVGIPDDKGGVYHTWQIAEGKGWQSSWTVYSPAPDVDQHGLVAGKDGSKASPNEELRK